MAGPPPSAGPGGDPQVDPPSPASVPLAPDYLAAGAGAGAGNVARQVSTMVVSVVRTGNPMSMVRAASWSNQLGRMGTSAPLFVIHDLGMLLGQASTSGDWVIQGREPQWTQVGMPPELREVARQYLRMVEAIAATDVVQKLASLRLRDDLIAVLLSRILGDTCQRWRERGRVRAGVALPLELAAYAELQPTDRFREFDPAPLWSFLRHLVESALSITTQVELIDLDTVRLLGLFSGASASGGAAQGAIGLDTVDLISALGSPEANDIANFSLDLLPSILETHRATSAQTFAMDGYASIERKGNVDSLVLSELAYDREIFEQKVIDDELLYYGREKHQENERKLQYLLVDSSASMRGQRQVFGRGLAVALLKKLLLQGDEVWFRFFDARLHEPVRSTRSAQVPVPYVLSFRSDRGRNYAHVARQLLADVTKLHLEQHRRVVVYLVTHGQCHFEPELIRALAQHAYLYGVIVVPSTAPLPDFTQHLHRLQVVTADTFATRRERRRRALEIVDDVRTTRGGGR